MKDNGLHFLKGKAGNNTWLLIICISSIPLICSCFRNHSDNIVSIGNGIISLEYQKAGGIQTGFRLFDDSINFVSWRMDSLTMPENNRAGACFAGHFLCSGRWGSPTPGEISKGIPHNGGHLLEDWDLFKDPSELVLKMHCKSLSDQLDIERTVKLDRERPVFHVVEKFTHTGNLARLFNVVQHVTTAAPFAGTGMRIYSNCGEGFYQHRSLPDPEEHSYTWPYAIAGDDSTNLSYADTSFNYVSTHIFADSIGWVVALDTLSGLFFGYLWNTSEYPFINFWNSASEGMLLAKGLEFGTTGVGKPYNELIFSEHRFKGRPSFLMLDAGSFISLSFTGFAGRLKKEEDIMTMMSSREYLQSLAESN